MFTNVSLEYATSIFREKSRIKAAHSSEISVNIFQTTWSHKKNNNLQVSTFQRKTRLHVLVFFYPEFISSTPKMEKQVPPKG
jgi:hypothetical protein